MINKQTMHVIPSIVTLSFRTCDTRPKTSQPDLILSPELSNIVDMVLLICWEYTGEFWGVFGSRLVV